MRIFSDLERTVDRLYDAALRPFPFDPLGDSPVSSEDKLKFVDGCLEWQGRLARAYGHENSSDHTFNSGSVLHFLFGSICAPDNANVESSRGIHLIELLGDLDRQLANPNDRPGGNKGLHPLSNVDLAECLEPVFVLMSHVPDRSTPLPERDLKEILKLASRSTGQRKKTERQLILEVAASRKWQVIFEFSRGQVLRGQQLALSLVQWCTSKIKQFEGRNLPRMWVKIVRGRCVVTTRVAGLQRGPKRISYETSEFLRALLDNKSWTAESTPTIKNDLCSFVSVLRAHPVAQPRDRGKVSLGTGKASGDKVEYVLSSALRGRVTFIREKRQSKSNQGAGNDPPLNRQ
jgi:hypothetical protein